MKGLLTLITVLLLYSVLPAQQVFLEVFSGYNFTAYDLEEFNQAEGYVPIGLRLAGGFEKIQLGAEFHQNISNPSFVFSDAAGTDVLRTEFVNTYKGGFVRVNFSSLPAYRFGLILKAGAGLYETERKSYSLPSDFLVPSDLNYEPTIGFNGGIGISAPIYTLLHWEIGYMYHMIKWDAATGAPQTTSYKGHYHSIQLGLSLNLVFGKVRAKCRRLVKGDRSSRGW